MFNCRLMRLDERVRVARLTYLRAVAVVRAQSTPLSWRRLLTASTNVRTAVREWESARNLQAHKGHTWSYAIKRTKPGRQFRLNPFGIERPESETEQAGAGSALARVRPTQKNWLECELNRLQSVSIMAHSCLLIRESRALCARARLLTKEIQLAIAEIYPAGASRTS